METLTESQELMNQLMARLPELEWKITEIDSFFTSRSLPRGLFRLDSQASGAGCIAEIKADINALALQKNKSSAMYLAQRINQKINVVVALCQIHQGKHKNEKKSPFAIEMLSTRKQWLGELEAKIKNLEEQQQAMLKALEHFNHAANTNAILQLKAELGEVERRLTLAKETFNRALSNR